MGMCGYHLRCLNCGKSCLDCARQYADKNNDYLNDVLMFWPKGKESSCVVEEER